MTSRNGSVTARIADGPSRPVGTDGQVTQTPNELIEVSVMRNGSAQLHLVGSDPAVVAAAIRAYADTLLPLKKPQVMRGSERI